MKTKTGELYFIKQRFFKKYSDSFPGATRPFPNVYANKVRDKVAFTENDGDQYLSYRPYLKVLSLSGNPEIGFYVPLSSSDMEYRKSEIEDDFYNFGKCTTYNATEDNLHYKSISLNRNAIAVRDSDIYSEANYRGVKKKLNYETTKYIQENVQSIFKRYNNGDREAFVTNPSGMANEMVRDINFEKQQKTLKQTPASNSEEEKKAVYKAQAKYTISRAIFGEPKSNTPVHSTNININKKKDEGRE